MNGYVSVVFSNDSWATNYTYMVPDNIELSDIQKYVVVENAFYDKRVDVSPYKVVKVVDKYETCPTDYDVTKYIVDTIDGETYQYNRNIAQRRKEMSNKLDDYFVGLSLEEKAGILCEVLETLQLEEVLRQIGG